MLKEAGVIDSGGAGLFYIADGIMKTINGNQPSADTVNASSDKEHSVDFSLFDENQLIYIRILYLEFLLRAANANRHRRFFRQRMQSISSTASGNRWQPLKRIDIKGARPHLHPRQGA